jgi:hypothetical protein
MNFKINPVLAKIVNENDEIGMLKNQYQTVNAELNC